MCFSKIKKTKKLPTGTVNVNGTQVETDLTSVGVRKKKKKNPKNTLLTESQIQRTSDAPTRREDMIVNRGDIFFRGENQSKKRQKRRLTVRGGVGRQSLLTSQNGGIGFYNKDA